MRCHAHLQRKFRNNLDHMIQPPQWHIARQWVSQTLPSVPTGHDHTDLRFYTASVDNGLSLIPTAADRGDVCLRETLLAGVVPGAACQQVHPASHRRRFFYFVRAADAQGHLSEGGAILPVDYVPARNLHHLRRPCGCRLSLQPAVEHLER
jgi:hypothetical protein